ncbi:MAG: 2-oxoglutarate dehydrogenase E1 component [Phycisphaerales bacterium]|nr:2-oxoglutarate dehydrogenase E1 component [Phycisphaerales bacterium]MCB9836471.1 2-oxoglutarate dehydrogenase E1 component [Phycisphaera sp.]
MSTGPKAQRPSVNGWNAEYLDSQYQAYLKDPMSVPADVRAFLQGYELALGSSPALGSGRSSDDLSPDLEKILVAYRGRGHLGAQLDPHGRPRSRPDALNLDWFGLTEADLDRSVDAHAIGKEGMITIRELINRMEMLYLGTVGVEVLHVEDYEERAWLVHQWEAIDGRVDLNRGEKIHILELLLNAGAFEAFLQKRYPGEKRFSLEGSESLIPLLDQILERLSEHGAEEVVLGMAHRGRLNVLNQILGKTYEQIFTEFEDTWNDEYFMDEGGDVKYHRGYSAARQFGNGKMLHLAMASNPSHLEAVGPVVEGRCRAKQRLRNDKERRRVVPVVMHGDAAVAGQGVVAETLNFSQLEGYTTGGTIHVVVNNQIGFTTRPEDSRSTTYCTDIAKSIGAPIFHVNGEDPEAVVTVARLAADYRERYKKDVFIDLWCYRKYGHNEQDEQSFTQPILAKLIKKMQPLMQTYAAKLRDEGVLSEHDHSLLKTRVEEMLDQAQQTAKSQPRDPVIDPGSMRWSGFEHAYSHVPADTAVDEDVLKYVCEALGTVPEGFQVNRKLKQLLESRSKLWDGQQISYADGEILAYGTLLAEGNAVRLSGQDSRRGTFSSRHAVLYDAETGDPYTPLNNISEPGIFGDPDKGPGTVGGDGRKRQSKFCVYDSPLSEASILAFEYGYSLADPSMLVCWEAQFGDFANGAQVIFDQFLASAQVKWERWSGLVVLLPHGYEGAGPEHSSARLERFLQLAGNNNMQIIHPTTGAQIFHALRRQVKRSFRKPLIVMTPKSLLRTPTSNVSELTSGRFHELMDDPAFVGGAERKGVKRIVLCCGKIYHELASRRDEIARKDVAIVRVEQVYPFHTDLARDILAQYPKDAELCWVQEEPRNMGAFMFIADQLSRHLDIQSVEYIGRDISASTAAGSKKKDRAQQESILTRAIGPKPDADAKDQDNQSRSDGRRALAAG